VDTLVVIT